MCSNNVSRRVRHDLSQISNIKFASNLGKYLGFPLIQGKVKKSDLNFMMESIQSKFATWKGWLLKKARKVTLAKSVLAAIPTYSMQQISLPQSVCLGIDKMVWNFIWGGHTSGQGIHLVNWNIVSSPRNYGRLGIRETRLANMALLSMLTWQVINEWRKPWISIL